MSEQIKSMIAITEAFPDGQRLTGAAIEYAEPVRNADVSPELFQVEGGTVTGAYTNTEARPADEPKDGRFVIVKFRLDDEDGKTVIRFKPPKGPRLGGPGGPPPFGGPGGPEGPGGHPPFGGPGGPKFSLSSTRREIAVTISQVSGLKATSGNVLPPFDRRRTEGSWEELVGRFQQFQHGGADYSLYIPESYDPAKKYPLVMFIPDATGGGTDPHICLEQGNGAVNFASEQDQEKHPSFVLGIQYGLEGPLTRDDFTVNEEGIQQILGVLDHVLDTWSIDRERVYTTGQSMGCMTSCELNIRRPELFAASLLVAGQWDPEKMGKLAHKNFWILVSEHDEKAFPGMNAITAAMENNGGRVARYRWNAKAGAEELDKLVEHAAAGDYHLRYTVFEGDTVVPEGEEANGRSNHMSTWPVVYGIDALRDWLFTQTKKG